MKKVLIIEDEQNIRETLSDLLDLCGYSTILAKDGEEGVQKATCDHPDLVLCDVNMPGMDGYQVLTELKKSRDLALVPFIFLTAKSSMEDLRTGMELGADDYLTKPFTYETLHRTIQVVEGKRIRQLDTISNLQDELSEVRLKIQDIDKVNSHMVRRRLSVLQSLIPLIKSGEIPLVEGLKILEESGEGMDDAVRQINDILNNIRPVCVEPIQIENPKSIWLIDDDPTQNLMTKTLLKKINPDWEISVFQDPKHALSELNIVRPDLVFLDISMPEMNGFDFLEQLVNLGVNLQVVMLSSSISPDDFYKSFAFPQVINYLPKPLRKEVIVQILKPANSIT